MNIEHRLRYKIAQMFCGSSYIKHLPILSVTKWTSILGSDDSWHWVEALLLDFSHHVIGTDCQDNVINIFKCPKVTRVQSHSKW